MTEEPQNLAPPSSTARLWVRISEAILPRPGDRAQRVEAAMMMLGALGGGMRLLLAVFLRLVWLLAAVFRRGAASREEAVAAWTTALFNSRIPLVHVLGQLLKASGCLVALSDESSRRAIYEAKGLELPSVVEPVASEPTVGLPMPAGRVADVADYVVVGSGPAGATVARALAKDGRDVILLEEGPPAPPTWQARNAIDNLVSRMRAAGMQTTGGPERLPVLQGRVVGGSSTVNSAIAWRAPEDVFVAWHASDPALAHRLPLTRIEAAYDAVEAAIHVEPTADAALGANNALMRDGARELGWQALPTDRYTRDCVGLGRCMEGCPLARKLSMNVTFVPEAVEAGARLYTDCQVRQVEFSGRRAVGVRARAGDRTVRIGARRAVILAASAVQTPILLAASGVRHAQLGRRFQAHPGASMAAVFDEPVRRTFGATQGFETTQFRAQRFKPETLVLADEVLASRLPGTGRVLAAAVDELPHIATWVVQFRARAHGSVSGSLGMPSIRFHLTAEDERAFGVGMQKLGEMFFAAGARQVLPNVVGLPARIDDPAALAPLAEGVHPLRVTMVMTHLFGTAVMGGDPTRHVCDPAGRVRGVDGLFVADSALFPTNMGVNPQHTIMAIAQHVAWGMLQE